MAGFLTEATKRRHELQRRKDETNLERIQREYLESLKKGKNKQSFSVQDAEKTAEKIADTPKEGFLDDFDPASDISDFYETVKEEVTNIGSDIKQWWEKDDVGSATSNLERIKSEHQAGGGIGYAKQTFPPPPPLPPAGPDPSEKMEAHRKRLAAQKNGLSNKDADALREKRGHPFGDVEKLPFAEHVEKVQKVGNVDALGEKIRPLGSGKAEDEALYYAKKSLQEYDERERWSTGSAYDTGETDMPPPPEEVTPKTTETTETVVTPTETVVPKEEGIMSVGGGTPDRYSSYPHDTEFEKMEYEEGKPEAGGGQGGSRTAEENKVHQDSKELNKKILDPNTPTDEKEDALEFRKKVYAHLPPRERALAKEETGNYWIDPISGVAINVDAIEADSKRKSNWLMIDKLPEHARPWFMAKFGYLDEEDVDKMPIDPKLKIAEMNMEAKRLELKSLEKRHTESTGVQYAQITGKKYIAGELLKWEKEKYSTLSEAQQQELQLKVHTQIKGDVELMFSNGQYEAGMLLAQGLNIPFVMDPKAFWRSKAKTSGVDPVFLSAYKGAELENMSAKTAGTKYNDKKGFYWDKLNQTQSEPGMGKRTYFEAKAELHGFKLWDQLTDAERAKAGNPMSHNNGQRSKLFNELLKIDPVFKHLHNRLNDARTAARLGDRGDGGEDKPKVVPKKEKRTISKKLDPNERSKKLLETSPVEGLKNIDTKYEFGAEKYTGELEGEILGLGNIDWDQYDSFMDWRNSKDGLRRINRKNLGPEKINKKLGKALKTGKKGFEELLAKEREKDDPQFNSVEEAAVYYNLKAGVLGDVRHGKRIRPDVKYYISKALK